MDILKFGKGNPNLEKFPGSNKCATSLFWIVNSSYWHKTKLIIWFLAYSIVLKNRQNKYLKFDYNISRKEWFGLYPNPKENFRLQIMVSKDKHPVVFSKNPQYEKATYLRNMWNKSQVKKTFQIFNFVKTESQFFSL